MPHVGQTATFIANPPGADDPSPSAQKSRVQHRRVPLVFFGGHKNKASQAREVFSFHKHTATDLRPQSWPQDAAEPHGQGEPQRHGRIWYDSDKLRLAVRRISCPYLYFSMTRPEPFFLHSSSSPAVMRKTARLGHSRELSGAAWSRYVLHEGCVACGWRDRDIGDFACAADRGMGKPRLRSEVGICGRVCRAGVHVNEDSGGRVLFVCC